LQWLQCQWGIHGMGKARKWSVPSVSAASFVHAGKMTGLSLSFPLFFSPPPHSLTHWLLTLWRAGILALENHSRRDLLHSNNQSTHKPCLSFPRPSDLLSLLSLYLSIYYLILLYIYLFLLLSFLLILCTSRIGQRFEGDHSTIIINSVSLCWNLPIFQSLFQSICSSIRRVPVGRSTTFKCRVKQTQEPLFQQKIMHTANS
jgi:hypothetical protein